MGGTKIIQLSETLKQIHSSNSSSILIKDEGAGTADADPAHLQHKLVITFEQPETGEMVIQHIAIQAPPSAITEEDKGSPSPLDTSSFKHANADIVIVPSKDGEKVLLRFNWSIKWFVAVCASLTLAGQKLRRGRHL